MSGVNKIIHVYMPIAYYGGQIEKNHGYFDLMFG